MPAVPSENLRVRPFLFASLPVLAAGAAPLPPLAGGAASADATEAAAAPEVASPSDESAATPGLAGEPASAPEPAAAPPPEEEAPASEVLVVLSQGSVADFAGDAIVNAANTGCLYGGGVDFAINRGGGQALEDARYALPVLDHMETRCQVGDAKRTIGGDLAAKWCIHAVGPNFGVIATRSGGSLEEGDRLLRSAYLAAMKRAEEVGAETVAFCLISAGIFRGRRSLEDVVTIAVKSVEEGAYAGLREVHLCAFTRDEVTALTRAATRWWEEAGRRPTPVDGGNGAGRVTERPGSGRRNRGDRVVAQGLQGAPLLNGEAGCILHFQEDKGRYAVRFDTGEEKLLKPENLADDDNVDSMMGLRS